MVMWLSIGHVFCTPAAQSAPFNLTLCWSQLQVLGCVGVPAQDKWNFFPQVLQLTLLSSSVIGLLQ